MSIELYEGIPNREINAIRKTSEGKDYTINHSKNLVVNMRFKGEGINANSQGWERSSSYYFKSLQSTHPEYFSKKNNALIEMGKAPVVDAKFAESFPQYKEYKGETLIHHHIGGDGQAVALPQSIHKGYGEIHSVEQNLGITDKAQRFSNGCNEACKHNPSLYGKTSNNFKANAITNNVIKNDERITKPLNSSNSIKSATHGVPHNSKNSSASGVRCNTAGKTRK